MPAPVVTVIPISAKVTSVKGGHSLLALEVGPMVMDGRRSGAATKTTVEIGGRGSTSASGPMLDNQFPNLFVSFPEQAVRVGGKFEIKSSSGSGMMGAIQADSTYTFAGLAVVNGRNAARLMMTRTKIGRTSSTSTGEVWISVEDGSTLRANDVQTIKISEREAMTQQTSIERR
jgi:hypothetical protein